MLSSRKLLLGLIQGVDISLMVLGVMDLFTSISANEPSGAISIIYLHDLTSNRWLEFCIAIREAGNSMLLAHGSIGEATS
jgi:hypothetical protein